ncbi:hypothetical protein ABT008_07155 [Micromonospora sp. NPDC002389]|uniref:hypothetical protein n=1 Tax=Micromonospora sp. NPDC002389 TaxID=3154272 RepID=UPI003333316C
MTNPQQEEFRRNERGGTSQYNKAPQASGHPAHRGSSSGDAGRPVPRGQVSRYGPTEQPVADDDSDRR